MSDNQNISPNKEYRTPYGVDLSDMTDPMQIEVHFRHLRSIESIPSLYKILTNFSTAEWIEDILREKLSLNSTQTKDTSRIIRDILLGDLYIGDMVGEIEKKLSIPNDKAKQIANLIVGDLFAQALDDIKILQLQKFKDRTRASGQPQKQVDPIIASQYQKGSAQSAQVPKPQPQTTQPNQTPKPQPQPVQPPRPQTQYNQPQPQPQRPATPPQLRTQPQNQQSQVQRTPTQEPQKKPIDLGYPTQNQKQPRPGDKGVVSNPANVLNLRDLEEK